ncbi:hypothetical protein ACN28S_59415 [Cystobacter fuscus]
MRGYKGVLSWGLCVLLVGCGTTREELPPGQDTPVPSEPTPNNPPPPTGETPSDTPETPSPRPTVPQVQPLPPPPGDVPPVKAGLEGEPTLKPVACVPWTGRVPPKRATACEGTSVFQDGHREVARYDADSRLLELRISNQPDGRGDSLERHTWENGRETFRRIESFGPRGYWNQIEWVYDAEGRLQKRTDTDAYETRVYQYVREKDGRLVRIDRLPVSDRNTPIFYRYNAAGQLVAIDSKPRCNRNVEKCETYTYWPNGKLHEAIGEFSSTEFKSQYDDRGYLVEESVDGPGGMSHTVYSHDSAGRQFRLWEKEGRESYGHEFVKTSYYDASGLLLLERFGKDTKRIVDEPNAPWVTTKVRTTRRLTYLCGTKIVWLDEWDGNEDGVVDARRTHERDDQGRLVHEEYSGMPGLDDGPVRRDFKYDCD